MPALNRPIDSPTFNLADQWCSPIDITNHCPQTCAYCTRYERHYRSDQLFHMSLEQIEQALKSYVGYPGYVGLIGGEPLVHPELHEICKLCQKYFPRGQLHFFTAGVPKAKWEEHQQILRETFATIDVNEHTPAAKLYCKHQPITMAVGEICEPDHADELIDACWVPRGWCKTINHKGAFLCELGAALDNLLDGPGGWAVEPGWWNRSQAECKDQRDRWCHLCGMCLPMKRRALTDNREKFTPKLAALFREHGLTRMGDEHIEIVDLKLTREQVNANRPGWEPWQYNSR